MKRTAILSINLSHYRSYRTETCDPQGMSVALFGPNGAGKTNVLEAVSLLSPGRGLRRSATDELVRRPDQLGWKVRADVQTPDGTVEIVTAAEGAEPSRRTISIDDKQAPQTALARLIRMVWLTPAMDRLWMEGAADRRRFLDRLTLGFEPGHGATALAYEKAMRDRNRLLKDGTFDDAWLSGLEAQMARSGAAIARARVEALVRLIAAQHTFPDHARLFPRAELGVDGDIERVFQMLCDDGATEDDLAGAEAEQAAAMAHNLAEARNKDAAAGRTLSGPHRSDLTAVYAVKQMPARACSTGEQKALLISVCLANARALTEFTATTPVLLFDEVAAHLDADRRRALYREIEMLGCQAWMTGTGPELFEGLNDAHRIAVSDTQGVSVLEPQ